MKPHSRSPRALFGPVFCRYQNLFARLYLFDFGSKSSHVRRNIGQRRWCVPAVFACEDQAVKAAPKQQIRSERETLCSRRLCFPKSIRSSESARRSVRGLMGLVTPARAPTTSKNADLVCPASAKAPFVGK